jgi:hypothetical protein
MSFIASSVFPSLHKSRNYEEEKKEREEIIKDYSQNNNVQLLHFDPLVFRLMM